MVAKQPERAPTSAENIAHVCLVFSARMRARRYTDDRGCERHILAEKWLEPRAYTKWNGNNGQS